MLLFAYWMGTYQLDHGLSIIETVGNDQQLNIAPLTVRGDMSIIPDDMKIQLVLKLFEYGFINFFLCHVKNPFVLIFRKCGVQSIKEFVYNVSRSKSWS